MRVFTDAEKQQLQTKIKDEDRNGSGCLEKLPKSKTKRSQKGRKDIISTALSFKYIMLGFLLFVLIGYVILLPPHEIIVITTTSVR